MKKIIFVIVLGLLMTACGSKINVTISENVELEYGEKLDNTLLFNKEKSDENLTVKEVKNFDNKKLGEQQLTVIFALEDKTQEEKVKVNVKDTKAPEIKLKKDKLEITEGDKFDPVSNIASVKDPADGNIKKSDDQKLTKNGYIVTSEVDTKKVKNGYKVKVTAYDVNGNKAEKTYTVNVKAKPKEPEQSTAQSSNTAPVQSSGGTGYTAPATGGSGSSTGSSQSNVLCPGGWYPEKACNVIVDDDGVGSDGIYYSTQEEADAVAHAKMKAGEIGGYWVYDVEFNDHTKKYIWVSHEDAGIY